MRDVPPISCRAQCANQFVTSHFVAHGCSCQVTTGMRAQGFDDKVGTILKQIYPPNMMRDLETSSQEAIIELAQAFPYQPSAGSAGLSRFQQVRHHTVWIGQNIHIYLTPSLVRSHILACVASW